MSDELRQKAMEACLELSKDACTVFDALEADNITMNAAQAIVRIGRNGNDLALAVQTILLTSLPGRLS